MTRIKLSLYILLCATLSCNGHLEKLLDPLNLSGAILKGISYINKYDGDLNPVNGQYSSASGSSSSASYSYGGSIDGAVNGFGVPSQTYVYQEPNHGHVEISRLTNNGGFVQDYGYGGSSHANGFSGQLQETSQRNYQQSNGIVEGGAYHRVPQTGKLGLTFNINLGGLLGLGHSKHSHHHNHKHHHSQGNINGDFYPENISTGDFHGLGQIQNHNEEYDRPDQIEYQNHGNQYLGYNRPEQVGNQNEQIIHETTYDTQQQEFSNYNPMENTNLSDQYNDNFAQNPIQNDRNDTPDKSNGQNQVQNVNIEPTASTTMEIDYAGITESTKTPYENEKNSKVTTSNRKTTVRPEIDQPLLVPLNSNEYTYEGDKIQIASPKRNAEENSRKQEINTKEEDFDIDVRFNDDE